MHSYTHTQTTSLCIGATWPSHMPWEVYDKGRRAQSVAFDQGAIYSSAGGCTGHPQTGELVVNVLKRVFWHHKYNYWSRATGKGILDFPLHPLGDEQIKTSIEVKWLGGECLLYHFIRGADTNINPVFPFERRRWWPSQSKRFEINTGTFHSHLSLVKVVG